MLLLVSSVHVGGLAEPGYLGLGHSGFRSPRSSDGMGDGLGRDRGIVFSGVCGEVSAIRIHCSASQAASKLRKPLGILSLDAKGSRTP